MVISEVRHYDHEKSNRNHLLLSAATAHKSHFRNDSSPPSYLEVLAEKVQQQQQQKQQEQQQCTTWDKKAGNTYKTVLRIQFD